jgi:hypothetical protein
LSRISPAHSIVPQKNRTGKSRRCASGKERGNGTRGVGFKPANPWVSISTKPWPGPKSTHRGSAGLRVHPLDLDRRKSAPMGRRTAGIESPNPRPSTQRAERAQHPDGGGADLRVRSAGHPSANPRPNGQSIRLDRNPIRIRSQNISRRAKSDIRPSHSLKGKSSIAQG